MDIRNVTQFAQFLSANNLTRLDPSFQQTVQCINNYAAACNCSKREDKLTTYTVCNKLYQDSARQIVGRFKNELLATTEERQISFYTENGQLIVIVSR